LKKFCKVPKPLETVFWKRQQQAANLKHLILDFFKQKDFSKKEKISVLLHLSFWAVLTGPDTPLAEEC